MKPSIVILTFNSEESIGNTLKSVQSLTDDIYVVDSGSTDSTVSISTSFGAKVFSHDFINYSAQRNWAIDNIPVQCAWQLHLDADECISDLLCEEIKRLPDQPPWDGYFVKRYLKFMGKTLRHNLAPTWHMRLFRTAMGRCELREYDQHFTCLGSTSRLRESMLDDIRMSLSEWTERHNRWSNAEVRAILSTHSVGRIVPKLHGNVVERKRFYKGFYDRSPLFFRVFGLFFYRYILRGGFLDGKEGLIFCSLQTFWFRFLVDAKILEATNSTRR
jgi:glycosyltransferase involved in cell wall biosynthesis